MKSTFSSYAFGCRVNQAEKETLDQQLLANGFKQADKNPDIFIINTCAVTNKAEREARQLIYQTKRNNPRTAVVVIGCAATKWIKEGKKVAGVDLAIDNNNKEFIAKLLSGSVIRRNFAEIGKNFSVHLPKSLHSSASGGLEGLKTVGVLEKLASPQNSHFTNYNFINSGRMYLKIQDGCQRFCTFCIVPYLRGQPKSFRIKYLVSSIRGLEKKNIKEVILTAINTQAFGYDSGEKLTDLIRTVLKETGIEGLSFGSVHPWSIDDDFLSLYKNLKSNFRFSKFLHIPLQSGSDRMLEYMKRGYTRREFLEKLKTLENIYPLTFIGTDIITGFLEETDKDFRDTFDFLQKSPIARFHVFKFSKREKTAAFFMSKRLKEPTSAQKVKRSKALIELGQKKYLRFLNMHLGKSFPALILERKIEGLHEALLSNQIPVLVKAGKKDIAKIKNVKIESQKKVTLLASISG